MLDYDNEARRLFAREHAERLADDMRRSRPLTPNEAGYSGRSRIGDLLRRAAHHRHTEEPEPRIPCPRHLDGPNLRRSARRRTMHKLATIGALVAALAAPASAAGQGVPARPARAQIACPQAVVILPGRGYGMCGHRIWVRDPHVRPGQGDPVLEVATPERPS